MEFNQEQAMKTIRWLVTTFGGGIVGFAAGRGWVDADMLNSLLTNETVIGALASISVYIWTYLRGRKKERVADVAAMPEVKGVVMEPVVANTPLVTKTPENVVPAGTREATEMAKAV